VGRPVAGSCSGAFLTSLDASGTPPDLVLRSRQSQHFRADLALMCPDVPRAGRCKRRVSA
jgi:hypothetical protein